MSLLNELKNKSENIENIKKSIIEEIKRYFDEKFETDALEKAIKSRIGKRELEERKVYLCTSFWAYHDGCSDTYFGCGGICWHNPENEKYYESRYYKGVELQTIHKEICPYLSYKLKDKMQELGFKLLSEEDKEGYLKYYDVSYYFGW